MVFLTTNKAGVGPLYSFTSADLFAYLLENVHYYATDGIGVVMGVAGADFVIGGSLRADDLAVRATASAHIEVTRDGYIGGAVAIDVIAGGSTDDVAVDNAGTIEARATAISAVGGALLRISNTGSLLSAAGILYANDVDDVFVSNAGLIHSSVFNNALVVQDSRLSIYNSGRIEGPGTVIQLLGASQARIISNTGDIFASGVNGIAIWAGGLDDTIQNTGTIAGHLILGDGADSITNAGRIVGYIDAGAGGDTIDTRAGSITGALYGGAGDDTYYISGDERIVEQAGAGTDTVFADHDYLMAPEIETLFLQGAAVTGTGNYGANTLYGNDRDNILQGRGGSDQLVGGEGDDRLFGGNGDDSFDVSEGGDDTFNGGRGLDTLTVAFLNYPIFTPLTVDLAQGFASFGDDRKNLSGIENVIGGFGADIIVGDRGANALAGVFGDDRLVGGDGDDRLVGGAGADVLDGGDGIDTVSYAGALGSSAGVSVDLQSGRGTAGDAAGDALTSIEALVGSDFADILGGSAVADLIAGGAGDDRISARRGDDVLTGGIGSDSLSGGAGADRFVFADSSAAAHGGWGDDTIVDFEHGVDRIDLSGDTGISRFANLKITGSGDNTLVVHGSDSILLLGVSAASLTAADFIFGS